ncbi:TRAP transporter large permease [Trinickia acidisoli]|uniref:TRAP transporter large permease n=1 Tax=Trinickia acidisoli TaxID=2767482 RepID=UPI001A90B92A|nr:TRAP transporter large permease subunit [Trinickia acidisoli]
MTGVLSFGEHRPPVWQLRCDTVLGWIVELPAALVVLAEVVVLLAGVISRFVFGYALVWGDELASILFLWLAMLGSAVALRRGDHMRMTVIAHRLPPAWRAFAEALAIGAPCVFLAIMLGPSIDYAQNQWVVQTPVMGLSDTVRVAAVPVGSVLMLAICGVRLASHRWRELAGALGTLAVIALALYLARDWIWSIGNWSLVIFFGVLLACGVLGGLPIAFCFGLSTVACLLGTTTTPLAVITGQMNEGMSSLVLLAVPLFVLLGQLIEMTRMANAMVAFLASLLGHVKGGLSFVLIGAMVLVSGISGAKTADMAAVAPVLFPEMKKRGIPEGELVSLLAACGAMAETIPPSLVLIIIGSVTGVSIAALFTGGLLPGLVLAVALGAIARRRTGDLAGKTPRASAKTVMRTFIVAVPALVLPVLIRFAVADGVATATEVSTIGIAYTVVVGLLVYRHFDWRRIYPMLVETASLSGAILLIIGAATAMAWALTQASFSQALAQAMAHMPGGSWGFLFISVIAFIVLGSVLEGIPAMVLFGALLFPIARQAGINEVHYAITVILAMGIGLFTPPFGLGYYAACTIGRVDPNAGLRRIWPYLGALVVGLAAVTAIPWISTGFLS